MDREAPLGLDAEFDEFFDSADYVERSETYEQLARVQAQAHTRHTRWRGFIIVLVAAAIPLAYVALTSRAPVRTKAPKAAVVVAPAVPAAPAAHAAATAVIELEADILVPGSEEAPASDPAPVVAAAAAAALSKSTLATLGGADPEPELVYAELSATISPRLLAMLRGKPAPKARRSPRRARRASPAVAKNAVETLPPLPAVKGGNGFDHALTLHDAGRSKEAIPHLQRLVRARSGDGNSLLLLGSIYQAMGRTSETRKAYEAYLQKHPAGKHAGEIQAILSRF